MIFGTLGCIFKALWILFIICVVIAVFKLGAFYLFAWCLDAAR